MGTPSGYQFGLVGVKDTFTSFGSVTTDSGGAATLASHDRAVVSVAEDGTTHGLFNFVLAEAFVGLVFVGATIVSASVKSGTLALASSSLGSKALALQYQESGSAAHLTSAGFDYMLVFTNAVA